MNKKLLLILPIIFLVSLFILPSVFSLSPTEVLDKVFDAQTGILVNVFGNNNLLNEPAMMAYLRLILFITLFVILFETLKLVKVFEDRKNSSIAIALAISAMAAFFVSPLLYRLLVTAYSTLIWWVLIIIPIVVLLGTVFMLIPPISRWFIALRILLLFLALYILDLIITTTSQGPKVGSLQISFTGIQTFSEWATWAIIILVIIEAIHLIKGGTADKKKEGKKEKISKNVPLTKRIQNIRKGFEDFSKNLSSLGTETKKDEATIKEDLESTNDLVELTKKLKDKDLPKEEREVIVAKIETELRDIDLPFEQLMEEIEPFQNSIEELVTLFQQSLSSNKQLADLRKKAIEEGSMDPAELTKLNEAINNIQGNIRLAGALLSKVGPEKFREINKEFENEKKKYAQKFGRNPDLALVYLEAMKASERKAQQAIESLKDSEDKISDIRLELQKSLNKISETLNI